MEKLSRGLIKASPSTLSILHFNKATLLYLGSWLPLSLADTEGTLLFAPASSLSMLIHSVGWGAGLSRVICSPDQTTPGPASFPTIPQARFTPRCAGTTSKSSGESQQAFPVYKPPAPLPSPWSPHRRAAHGCPGVLWAPAPSWSHGCCQSPLRDATGR